MIAGMAGGRSVASYYRSADRSDVLAMRSWIRILHSAGKDGPALETLGPAHGLTADVDQFVVELRLVEHVPNGEADVLGFEAVSKAIHGVRASGEGGGGATVSTAANTALRAQGFEADHRFAAAAVLCSFPSSPPSGPLCSPSCRWVGTEGGGVNRR